MENSRQKRQDQPKNYRIIVQGQLDAGWSEWFDGMTIVPSRRQDGTAITIIAGPVTDQVALHSVLVRICDLGLPLLQVECIESSKPVCRED